MTDPTTIASSPADRAHVSPLPYRPDIDGLRAVAVAGVVLFHYGVAPVGGGYTGVDVFFVISGYFITAILSTASRDGRLSLMSFAERRLRRILPALLLVIAVCSLAATRLLPNDMKLIGLGLINAVTFTSNLFFGSLAEDYFAAGALAIQPALHTWSLSVEAQFYLAVATVWWLGRHRTAGRRRALVFLSVASFGFSLWSVARRPELAFYQLPSRLWEFTLGGALVSRAWLDRWAITASLGRAGAAGVPLVGLTLIGLSFVLFSSATPFPGAAALLPCLGAALVIVGGGSRNGVSRVLGAWPMAIVGRLSYSLYLWHWPILVFATYGRSTPLPLLERLQLLGLTGFCAWLTWRLVERPIIERRLLKARKPLLVACAAGVLAVAGLGLIVNLAGQNIVRLARLPADVQTLADGRFDVVPSRCDVGAQSRADCRFGDSNLAPTVAVWGNSFARMWMPGIDRSARRHGVSGLALVMSRCPPLIETALATIRGCAAFNRDALAAIEARPELGTVILAGDWDAWTPDLPALGRTIAVLRDKGRRVVVALAPPLVPYDVPRTLALAAWRHEPPLPLLRTEAARTTRASLDSVLDPFRSDAMVRILDPFDSLCDAQTCQVEQDGRALYYDARHITRYGAEQHSRLFDPVFQAAASD